MTNLPEVKVGVVAVSRDCFPESLSVNRRKALMEAYAAKYGEEGVSALKFQRRCLQSILTVLLCLLQQQRNPRMIW